MKNNPYPGKFIVVEGLDGSGQSTQVSLIREFLINKGFDVVSTKEPTQDSEAGKQIKKILTKMVEAEPRTLQELFVEDRREHLEKLVIPALKEGKIVVSDRYFFSTFAFGSSSGIDLETLIEMNNGFLLPDLTFILKVKPEVCFQRIEKRGDSRTLFEETEKLKRVWQTYAILPDRFKNVYMIEGEKPIEEVFFQIKALLQSKINL